MLYRVLGKSDIQISALGFGCMSLEPENSQNESLLHQALEGGINYFDTADLYQKGLNETILGRAFRGKRDQVVLATKWGNQWKTDGSGWDWNADPKYMITALEKSLKRLQTDYIDLYQLHGGTLQDPADEIIEGFENLKKSGKIRAYGISSIRPNVIREYVKKSSIDSVMMQYSILDRRPEEEMLSLLFANQISVLVRGSIAKGLLVSKPAEPFLNYPADQVKQVQVAMQSESLKKYSSLKVAIQYVLQREAVSAAALGIRTAEQLREALAVVNSESIPTSDLYTLETVLPPNTYSDHR